MSPFGYECIGGPYGSVSSIRTYAIKRVVCDEFIAKKAQEVGASLLEEHEVKACKFINKGKHNSYWEVECTNGELIKGKILMAADGSNSYIAKNLGIVNEQPQAFCSHQYVEGGTHDFKADGVMIYNKSTLPGYSALFKHYDGDMYLGTYILPGGKATSRVIPHFEKELIENHPYVNDAFTDNYRWHVKSKTAPIRIGGIKKSYGDHLLIIGDAAGQVDPLTGEGIHTAMIAGKIAAETVLQMFSSKTGGDFSEKSTSVYHRRWVDAFGSDFVWSGLAGRVIYWCPLLLDATCVVGNKQGQLFLDEFGAIMTGVKSKSAFLFNWRNLLLPITVEIIRQFILQKIFRKSPLVPTTIGQSKVDQFS